MKWDEWRGSSDVPTLWIKRLFKFGGCRLDLHKMIAPDAVNCFHTHPAHALRVVLWGGYVEELEDNTLRMWNPGMIGVVSPSHSHRISELRNGRSSYSLWLRLRVTHKVHLRGSGWA